MKELVVITKLYDLIKWYVPRVQKLPRNWRFVLGERIETNLYDILDDLIKAKYSQAPVSILRKVNIRLERLRYQTRLLVDFDLLDLRRYNHVAGLINDVGMLVGGWIKSRSKSSGGTGI